MSRLASATAPGCHMAMISLLVAASRHRNGTLCGTAGGAEPPLTPTDSILHTHKIRFVLSQGHWRNSDWRRQAKYQALILNISSTAI